MVYLYQGVIHPIERLIYILIAVVILLHGTYSHSMEVKDSTQIKANNCLEMTIKAQRGIHASAPGSYELAIRALKTVVNPGDVIKLEIFITGYGNIQGAKMMFLAPTDFIIKDKDSYIADHRILLRFVNPTKRELKIVEQKNLLDGVGSIGHLIDITHSDWRNLEYFFDKYFIDNSLYSFQTATINTDLPGLTILHLKSR